MALIDFFFDFETRSRVDLKRQGTINYVMHPSTQATLLTYCFGRNGAIKAWRLGQPVPEDLYNVMKNPQLFKFVAHNIGFDFLVWTVVWKRQMYPMLVNPKVENLDDNMALSCHFRVGGSLDAVSRMLGLPYSKDAEGRKLMLKQCKPNAKGFFYELTPAEWDKFEHYGIVDTKLLRQTYYMMPALPPAERFAWEWTFRRNMRGVRIDVDLLNELKSIVDEHMPRLEAEFEALTGGVSVRSPKCKDIFKPYYPWIEDMQADTVRDMLLDPRQVPPAVRRALEIKELAGSSSVSKIDTAFDQMAFGMIYNILAYHFAQTKRWAGRGMQLQNLPRVDERKPDKIDFDLNVKDLASVVRAKRPSLKDPIGFVKNLIRRLFLPLEGMTFYCGDFSRIEPTSLFWLLGLGPIPPKWYEEMGGAIYNIPTEQVTKDSEARQIGKKANLSCMYGTGWEKFKAAVAKDTGIVLSDEMATKAVATYREQNPKIIQFWRDLENAFRRAIKGETVALCEGKIYVMPMDYPYKGVQIRIPSGGLLFYHNAQIRTEEYLDKNTGAPKYREVIGYVGDEDGVLGFKKVYGGLLCEHVTSATARDVLVPSVWRLEQQGFDVLCLIHDEVWAQAKPGLDELFTKTMCVRPSWCQDMHIDADLKPGVRYLK